MQQQQQQQQLFTGRPLVKEAALFQQPQVGNRANAPPFSSQMASNAAITGVAVELLRQQQQHQLLAAAAASAASQNQQLKQQHQQMLQQQHQQRTSPLQQSLMGFAGGMQASVPMQNHRPVPPNVPVANRTHFRPIHPQPMIPPISGMFI